MFSVPWFAAVRPCVFGEGGLGSLKGRDYRAHTYMCTCIYMRTCKSVLSPEPHAQLHKQATKYFRDKWRGPVTLLSV